MEIHIIWLLLCIMFNSKILANCLKIQTATYLIHRKHPDIRKCAMDILQNNTVVGARLSDRTGKCENLTDETHTLEPGYRYVEKVYFEIKYQPPISDMIDPNFRRNFHILSLPRTMWSRLDFKIVRKPPSKYDIVIDKHGRVDNEFSLRVGLVEKESRLYLHYPLSGSLSVPFDWQIMCPMDVCKFSLLLNDQQVQILANNKNVPNATYEVERTLVRQRRDVYIDRRSAADVGFISFAFTKQ